MFPPLSKYQTPKLTNMPGLQRARKPFIVRNILTGIILVGFVGAVCILFKNKNSINIINFEKFYS